MSTQSNNPPYYESKEVPFSAQRSEHRAEIGRRVSKKLESTLGVQRVEVDPERPAQVYTLENFLTAEECAAIIPMIDAGCVPSKLFEPEKYVGVRTSKSCDLDPFHPLIADIEQRLADLLEIDRSWGEPLQGQRYLAGEEYKPHSDFFYVDQPYWAEVEPHGGQRTWTAMVYLNQPTKGGATGFPFLNLMGQPWPGRMLIWNNMAEDGSPNNWTIHSGEPVEEGAKYIATKWYRERPYV